MKRKCTIYEGISHQKLPQRKVFTAQIPQTQFFLVILNEDGILRVYVWFFIVRAIMEINFFQDGSFLFRLFISFLLGALIGIERQMRGRPAGLRTNILVCVGSAAIIVAFQKLAVILHVGAESAIRMDPARAAAGVITGIGFLGAGTIIKSSDFVRGLTTAASIWVVSAIGIIIGLGEYVIGVFLTILVLISLYSLHRLPLKSDYYFLLQLTWQGKIELLDEVLDTLKKKNAVIKSKSLKTIPQTGENFVSVRFKMRLKDQNIKQFKEILEDKRFSKVFIR